MKIDQLSGAIADELRTFSESTSEAMISAVNKTAEKAAEIVRNRAKHFGESYAGDIKARTAREARRKGAVRVTAYVTATDHYRVAHLLEHGHAKVAGGRVTGFWEGYEHFKQGEDYVDRNLVENLKNEVEKI